MEVTTTNLHPMGLVLASKNDLCFVVEMGVSTLIVQAGLELFILLPVYLEAYTIMPSL